MTATTTHFLFCGTETVPQHDWTAEIIVRVPEIIKK